MKAENRLVVWFHEFLLYRRNHTNITSNLNHQTFRNGLFTIKRIRKNEAHDFPVFKYCQLGQGGSKYQRTALVQFGEVKTFSRQSKSNHYKSFLTAGQILFFFFVLQDPLSKSFGYLVAQLSYCRKKTHSLVRLSSLESQRAGPRTRGWMCNIISHQKQEGND